MFRFGLKRSHTFTLRFLMFVETQLVPAFIGKAAELALRRPPPFRVLQRGGHCDYSSLHLNSALKPDDLTKLVSALGPKELYP